MLLIYLGVTIWECGIVIVTFSKILKELHNWEVFLLWQLENCKNMLETEPEKVSSYYDKVYFTESKGNGSDHNEDEECPPNLPPRTDSL